MQTAYCKLLEGTGRVVGQAKKFSAEIVRGIKRARPILQQQTLQALQRELDTMRARMQQVMRQSKARLFEGETRVEGKLVSIFEPDTEIIRKGKASKPTEFGKLVKIQEAENQIITAYEVYEQRPNDRDLLVPGCARPDTLPRGAATKPESSGQPDSKVVRAGQPQAELRASNALGISGRQMLEAIIAGQENAAQLAQMAGGD